MPSPGDVVSLAIEKPAAGGRMIARLNGQIVLVGGAIPGEQIAARVERVGKGVVYAETIHIEAASPDRRPAAADPLCGGCLFNHIAYPRQLEIKSQIVADAFGRIGRLPLSSPVRVTPSPEAGYRMRARLHVRAGRAGFFREGTHELCDVRATGQLLPATCDVLDVVATELTAAGAAVAKEVEVSENVDASERAIFVDAWRALDARTRERLAGSQGVTAAGPDAFVTDAIVIGTSPAVRLRRNVRAFFQGNRYLLRDLASHVAALVPSGEPLLDLYAGSGLFALTAAAVRGCRVTAVEGDAVAASDLGANAAAFDGVSVHHQPVEAYLQERPGRPSVIVLDPPRTGLSRAAAESVSRLRAGRVIYVSCDPATLARDARLLVDGGGYRIERADAFDLFPGTPHVETVAMFTLS
jgi:23S rRNA (uracil1939-C5)-methyltransferase